MQYLKQIATKKTEIDSILVLHKAQPVGWGYTDTIIHRNEIKDTINKISKIGFLIRGVSWWEYLKDSKEKAIIGMGGPISVFYPGWFAETQEYDEINPELFQTLTNEYNHEKIVECNKRTLELILKKETRKYGKEKLSYIGNINLTPGLWIEVPDDWVNPFTDPDSKQFLLEYQKMRDENKRKNFA